MTQSQPVPLDGKETEALKLEIEDTLYGTVLQDYSLQQIIHATPNLYPGWYVSYYIPGDFVQRAVYLGPTAKLIKRKFNQWVRNWMVQ